MKTLRARRQQRTTLRSRIFRSPNLIVAALLFGAVVSTAAAQSQSCLTPDQPDWSKSLARMVIDQPDDAMQCIIHIAEQESEVPGGYTDEIKYLLAKQASVAIDALGQGFRPYSKRAAELWRGYLDKASTPVEKTRLLTGITNVLHHARFGEFEEYIPTIVGAMSKARAWLAPVHADQFFTTVNRCPVWLDTKRTGPIPCSSPCPDIGRSVLSSLKVEFGNPEWPGSSGIQRLAINSRALETRLACTR